jgi:hypothetical protein
MSTRRSLASAGQLVQTFAGIGYSLAISLLALGGYLVARQFQDPLEAQSVILLFAAVLIATSCALLWWLLRPFCRTQHATDSYVSVSSEAKAAMIVRIDSRIRIGGLPSVRLHQRYFDRTRVLIQR